MDDGLLTALAGGMIGTIILGIAWAITRLYAIPSEVALHDEIACVLDEDLELWVADDHGSLRRELADIENDMNKRGLLWSSAHGVERSDAKSRALHRYRDQKHAAERKLADLKAREHWPHGLWRRLSGRPELGLTAPGRVERVLDEWRADVIQHGSGPADRIAVHDPTRWRLEDLLDEIEQTPLEKAKY